MARKGHRQTKDIYNFEKGSRKNDFTPRDAVKTVVTLVGLGIVSEIAKSTIK